MSRIGGDAPVGAGLRRERPRPQLGGVDHFFHRSVTRRRGGVISIVVFACVVGIVAGFVDAAVAPPHRTTAPISSVTVATAGRGAVGLRSATLVVDPVGTSDEVAGGPDLVEPTGPAACGSRSHCVVAGSEEGAPAVLITSDGGVSWRASLLGPSSGAVAALSCPTGTLCLAAVGTDLFATDDGGRSWRPAVRPTDLDRVTALSCAAAHGCLVAGQSASRRLVLALTDAAGARWHAIPTPPITSLSALDCLDWGCLLGGAGLAGRGEIFRSDAEKTSWRRVLTLQPSGTTGRFIPRAVACGTSQVCDAVATSSATPRVALVFRSVDGGRNFAAAAERTVAGAGPISLSCRSAVGCLLAGGSSDLLLTTDGGVSWTPARVSHARGPVAATSVACSAAPSGLCLSSWTSSDPDRFGIAVAAGKALASPTARFSEPRLPSGLPGLRLGCGSSADCIVAAPGWSYVAVVGAGLGHGGLLRLSPPPLPGYSAPVVKTFSCAAGACVAEITQTESSGQVRPSLLVWDPTGDRPIDVAEPASAVGGRATCDERLDCAVSLPPGRQAQVDLTADGGGTWRTVSLPRAGAGDEQATVACWSSFACEGVVFSSARGGVRLYRTADGGTAWRRLTGVTGRLALHPRTLSCDAAGTCALVADTATTDYLVVTLAGSERAGTLALSPPHGHLVSGVRCRATSCFAPAVVGSRAGVVESVSAGTAFRFVAFGGTDLVRRFEGATSLNCPSASSCLLLESSVRSQTVERLTSG